MMWVCIPPITSYAVILYAAMLHLTEAIIIVFSRSADQSVPISALLDMMPNRYGVVLLMLSSAVMALATVVRKRLSPVAAVILLAPQQALARRAERRLRLRCRFRAGRRMGYRLDGRFVQRSRRGISWLQGAA